MPPFRWEDIDHSLVSLRLTELAIEMRDRTKTDEAHIRFENRSNLNSNAVPSLVLKMKRERADEWAQRVYEIYCDVWQKQGNVKSAAFVRAVFVHGIVPVIRARTGAIAYEFSRFATATNFPGAIRDGTMQAFQLNMLRLEDHWRRRLEIEARECEHAERRARLGQQGIQERNVAKEETPMGAATGAIRQPLRVENRPEVHRSSIGTTKKKPGRLPRLGRPFVECAGALWQKAILDGDGKVSIDKLRQIASALDEGNYLPPSAHLEGKCARELKEFNSRNSNSKIHPVKTWSRLLSLGDKDLLRGMRRLLSRCAKKLDGRPVSGI